MEKIGLHLDNPASVVFQLFINALALLSVSPRGYSSPRGLRKQAIGANLLKAWLK